MARFDFKCLTCESLHEANVPFGTEEIDCLSCGSIAQRQFSPPSAFMLSLPSDLDPVIEEMYQKGGPTLKNFGNSTTWGGISSSKPKTVYPLSGKTTGLRLKTPE